MNELGVAEPIIQQQGAERVVVQLPGVQDTARAKDILGRTASLEVRMVNDDPGALEAAIGGSPPLGSDLFTERSGQQLVVRRQVVLTGDRINDAQPGFDQRTNEPAVHINLDSQGANIFKEVTRENVGKRMAIVLVEKGKAEVITAPVIREEIGGGRVQISGRMTTREANDVALLMRAGALAAPMEIVEERTVGPSLGAENIEKGFQSVMYGFIVLSLFICVYYLLMGVISTIALAVNLLLLVALLSMLQATLTLPGIAAIALTLGMAIDANVLINERIREELRWGATPHAALQAGYERAWGTILDSNVTTLIAGVALLHLRQRSGARIRDRALPGHPDLDVLGGVRVARHRGPDLRQSQEARPHLDRPGLATRQCAAAGLDQGLNLADSARAHLREREHNDKSSWNSFGSAATSRSCGTRSRST